MNRCLVPFALLIACACTNRDNIGSVPTEKYRPSLHFSPARNWTNDPNGLVHFDGEFHLFYQYNPYGDTWGHMSWGHAVSTDLLSWTHLPVALPEYVDRAGDSVMVFSGSVVVDKRNTSGLCTGDSCLVAIYTSHVHKGGQGLRQHQSVAYSNDRGRSWTYYDKNPVLDIGRKDFRDPKVFWHEPTNKWVMILVVPDLHKAQLYESTDLLAWSLMSEFGPQGDTAKIWECPDLFEAPVENQPENKRWVLSLSGSHPQGPDYVGMQYFSGSFDGREFRADNPEQYPLYVDYGKDFYAGIVYNNFTTGARPVMLAWVNNWAYAKEVPTSPWRGAMSLPRQLSLLADSGRYRLIQQPLRGMTALREDSIQDFSRSIAELGGVIELEVTIRTQGLAGIKLFKTDDEETTIAYDAPNQVLLFDRTQSGRIDFHPLFASMERAPLRERSETVRLRIFIDGSIVEVFAEEGGVTLTQSVFPSGEEGRLEVFTTDDQSAVSLKGWQLRGSR